ncbi:hypothetical protein [Clostridium perfringens]|uniref:hypothetical protein n=1 Tax=Clostridium perfringens TaxID=1502 RepID=UPI0009945A63|nr:hypothetical protein [Clostridium perfringens]AQW23477.1 hypothetical protein BXT91_06005 [Clostridium perfringens]ATD48941.1 hypothetical protein CMR01_09160 [Clostridium perfringens]
MYKTTDLDKRICDLEEGATNTETLREFINHSEKEFELERVDLDSIRDKDLDDYIDYLDNLWCS